MRGKRFNQILIPVVILALLAVVQCNGKPSGPVTPVRGPGGSHDYSPAWSPDGQWIVFARLGDTYTTDTLSGLYKIRRDGTELTRLLHYPESGLMEDIDWCLSGWILVTGHPDGTYRIRPDGSSMSHYDSVHALYASWSPDCTECALVIGGKQWLMDSSGTNLRRVDPTDTSRLNRVWYADWGANGKILHSRYVDGKLQPVVAEIDPATAQLTVIDSNSNNPWSQQPRYIPGSSIAFVNYINYPHPQLITKSLVTASQRCLTCGDKYNDGASFFDVNPITGEFVYTRTKYTGLWIVDSLGRNPFQLTDPPWPPHEPSDP